MSGQTSAAQSAPAGEREAFEAWFDESVKPSVSYGNPDILRRSNLPAFQAGAAWQRTQSAGVPDVSAMARVLSDRSADACNIDRTDNWAMYGQEYIEDVQAMLAAAAPAQPAAHDQGEVLSLRDWIACTERLPADKRDVMVYCADSDEHMVGSSVGGGLFLFATASHGEKVVCRPTHWRYIDESDKPDLAASTAQQGEGEKP